MIGDTNESISPLTQSINSLELDFLVHKLGRPKTPYN